jgi:hypothetical protein
MNTDNKTTFFIPLLLSLWVLTAPPAPVQATTAEDQKQNNDYQYGFHDFSPFF